MPIKLGELYRMAISIGMDKDPRSKDEIDSDLARVKKRYGKLEGKEKERFDQDSLWNPYPDSRLLFGELDREVNGVLWGIDITPAEVLLADRLREKGKKIDAIIGHHPRGAARGQFPEAVHLQEYLLQTMGVPISVAEDVIAPRIREVHSAVAPENINQSVDAARLLDMPFMCLHSCTDNLVQRYLEQLMEEKRPDRVEDVINALLELPEFDHMARHHNPPEVYVGDKNRHAGKIMVKMTGGTSGPKEMYELLAAAGVTTYIGMHLPDSHIDEAKKHHINVIISGHMASDSLGINLLADQVEAKGVDITPCSGFIRVRRG